MKFLESAELLELTNHFLTDFVFQDIKIDGLVEAYSCKKTVEDKKFSKVLERKLVEVSASPKLAASPLGPLNKAATRKMLIHLVSTMNAAFQDYDFSGVSPRQFEPEDNIQLAINSIDERILNAIDQQYPTTRTKFWTSIDEMIKLNECQCFRYVPDPDDALTRGKLWSFTYFFFNKKLNRVLLFTASAERKMTALNLSQEEPTVTGPRQLASWAPTGMQIATEPTADAAYVVKSPRVGPVRVPLEPSPFDQDFRT